MNYWGDRRNPEGAIIVLALIMLLVMTTMGIGLWYVADRDIEQVEIKANQSETLYSAESCIDDATRWLELEAAKAPPCKSVGKGKLCTTIPDTGVQTMDAGWRRTSGEKTKHKTRMAAHNYKCTITLINTISAAGQQGTGFNVGQTSNYQGSISSTKYLYKITSSGLGPNNVRSDVEIIASTISSL